MRKTKLIAAVSALSVLALAACADDDSGEGDGNDKKTAAVTTDSGLKVTGEPGEKPKVEVPEGKAPTDLQVDVLEEGDGEEVKAGDWLVTDYLGQTWDVTGDEDPVFDNSWDRGQPAGFVIGKGQVIKGWDDALVGQKIGSRVALTIPPELAYGEFKESELQKDTLVFVVEIRGAVDPMATAEGEEVDNAPADAPVVTSDKEGLPKVDFSGAKKPKESKATVVIEGDGPKLGAGAVVHFAQGTYTEKKITVKSWDQVEQGQAPQVMTKESYSGIPGLADAMKDVTVGSRVMVEIAGKDNPGQDGSEGQPAVLIVDVIGTYGTAA